MALTDNIKAYWKLDNVNDSVASYNLTNVNSVSFSSAKIGNGADFGNPNTNKILNIADNLGITGGNITISLWVKLNAEIGSGDWCFGKQDNVTNFVTNAIYYQYNGGTRRLAFSRVRNSIIEQALFYNITLGTSDYYHLVYTYDGTNITGYINGTGLAPVAASGVGSAGGSNSFNIGAWVAGTYHASCIVDEVGVWNRALTSTEVTELYNGGAGITYPFSTPNTSNFFQLF